MTTIPSLPPIRPPGVAVNGGTLSFNSNGQLSPYFGSGLCAYADRASGSSRFNFNPLNLLQTPYERLILTSTARYEITDNIQLKVLANYVDTSQTVNLAPTPATGISVPYNSPLLPVSVFVPAAKLLSDKGIAFLELREPGPDGTFGSATQPRVSPEIRKVFARPARGGAAIDQFDIPALARKDRLAHIGIANLRQRRRIIGKGGGQQVRVPLMPLPQQRQNPLVRQQRLPRRLQEQRLRRRQLLGVRLAQHILPRIQLEQRRDQHVVAIDERAVAVDADPRKPCFAAYLWTAA